MAERETMSIMTFFRSLWRDDRKKASDEPQQPVRPPPFDEDAHALQMARIEFNIASHWDQERLEAELRQRVDPYGNPLSNDRILVDTVRIIKNIQQRRASRIINEPPLIFVGS